MCTYIRVHIILSLSSLNNVFKLVTSNAKMLFRVKRLFINNFAKCVGQKRFKHTEFEPLFERMKTFWNKTAIHDYKGSYTYGNVFLSAKELSQDISRELGGKIHERVLFLCSNDVNYVVTLLAIWMSGQTGQ